MTVQSPVLIWQGGPESLEKIYVTADHEIRLISGKMVVTLPYTILFKIACAHAAPSQISTLEDERVHA